MLTLDGIIFTSRSSRGGIAVYFRELIQRSALSLQQVEILVHDAGLTADDLRCAPAKVGFRSPRFLERFRDINGLPAGILHSSYYRISPQKSVLNVLTVYDFTYEKFMTGPRVLVHTTQKKRAIRRAEAVMCISHSTRRDLLNFLPDFPPSRAFVTHLAASEAFRPIVDPTRRKIEGPFVLFVGARAGYKNFSSLVKAMGLTSSTQLVCTGGGSFTTKELQNLQATIPGRYRHVGQSSIEDLNSLYNEAVCLVYPSLYEGFGIPLLEAMNAGCPFVALNQSSIPEVAGGAGILLSDPDPDGIVAALKECALPTRRAELRLRGFEQAMKFSWAKMFAETVAIYRSVDSHVATAL